MNNQIGLDTKYAEKMSEQLNVYLSNVQMFYMNVRGYHWNIVGPQFFSLHAKFEELYDALNEMADEIAERILMLEGRPLHSFTEYLNTATIKERTDLATTAETINAVREDMMSLLEQEREIAAAAAEAGDEGTVDMVTGYIPEQEKLLWMFGAMLK